MLSDGKNNVQVKQWLDKLLGLCFVGNNGLRGGMLTLNTDILTQMMLNAQGHPN